MQNNALLTQYTQSSFEAAFAQLLARHLPLVYRTCHCELGPGAPAGKKPSRRKPFTPKVPLHSKGILLSRF